MSDAARRWLRRGAIAFGIVVLLIALAWLAVPWIARHQIETRLSAALARPVSVEKVEFNPFSLRFVLRNLTVGSTTAPAPLLAIEELTADVSSASLWHRAPVLDALRIVQPRLALARGKDGGYDIDDLIERAQAPSEGPRPAFSLNNIEIVDGSVAFDDAATARQHRVDGIAVGIPFLSSLPYQTDIRVTPHLEGSVNGSHFGVSGSATPFAEQREATLEVNLDGVALPQYVAYLPVRPRLDLAQAVATTRLTIAFVDGPADQRRLEIRGEAHLDDVAVKRRDGRALLGAKRIGVTLDRIDVFARDARLAKVTIDAPSADVVRAQDGTLELAQPLFDTASPARATAAAPWTVRIGELAISDGRTTLTDEATAFRTELADIVVAASNVTNVAGEKAKASVAFVSADRIATFKAEAEADLLAPAATGSFALAKFSLGLLFPYYKDALAAEVQKGSLDFQGAFALTADGKLTVTDGAATIAELALAYPGSRQPFLRLPAVSATGIGADIAARRIEIASLEMRNPVALVARERNGTIDVTRIVRTAATTGTDADAQTWTLLVDRLAVQRASLDVEDRMQRRPLKLTARGMDITARGYSNARGAKTTVALRARLGQRARVAYDGTVGTNPFALAGAVDVSGLDLVSVRPYVEAQVNVSLTGGALAAKGRVTLDLVEDGPARATWKGDVTVTDFAALDKPTASDLARWKRLALDNVDLASAPFRLSIDRIDAADYYARVIVYQDGTLNLTRLLTPGAAPAPAPDAKPAPDTAAPPEALPVTLGRIELANGNVNFSDFFITPNYSANLTEVTGSISRMSTTDVGDVAIAARVDHSAPVEIAGRIQPFAPSLSLDLTGKARDVDLPPMSPYAIKYAGYGIERGKLAFDVHYKVEDRRLTAQNRLVLDQLTFNPQRVDSPTATKLPVLLAVALLKNSRGVIDIQLPISGSLDDPEFSVGGLIVQVIVNLLTKAVTAPFALLSAAFGHGEELSVIVFTPGASMPGDDVKARLDTLGKALADRPALRLDVSGRADPAADREALRRKAVEDTIRREKMKALAATGKAPASLDEVTVDADERTRWLTRAYRGSSIAERPRNAFGMLEEVPPAQMEAMILAHAEVDDDALRLLANARAQAVKDALQARSVAGERIFITAPHLGTEAASRGGAAPGRNPPSQAPAGPVSRVDLALR